MRLFVAVFPPPPVREALVTAARELAAGGNIRLTVPENVHLTLKFLGDVAETNLERVAEALGPLCGEHEPFEAETSGFGAFPSKRRARVLWAGVGAGSEGLAALARNVDAALEPLGFAREDRPYVPHITLGRARGRPGPLETDAGKAGAVPALRFEVPGMSLVESVSGGEGVIYAVVTTYPFSGGGSSAGGSP